MFRFKQFLLEYSYGAIIGKTSSDIEKLVSDIQKDIDPSILTDVEDTSVIKGGIQTPGSRHVTLFYGLTPRIFKGDDYKKMLEALSSLKPLKYKITGIDYFYHNTYTVAKLNVESPDLKKAHEMIKAMVPEYKPDFSVYKPHITIAYLKPGKKLDNIKINKSSTITKAEVFDKKAVIKTINF